MSSRPATRAESSTGPGQIAPLVASWRRSLAARRVSPATISTYSSAALLLADFLAERGMPSFQQTLPGRLAILPLASVLAKAETSSSS